jgi:hypothetical protein
MARRIRKTHTDDDTRERFSGNLGIWLGTRGLRVPLGSL